jgi:uncharacterized membrane protein
MSANGLATIDKGDTSGVVDAARLVVRDQEAWRALWAAHAATGAQPPAVDFSTRTVAAAFAGERPSPGYEIEIVDMHAEGSGLAIVVQEAQPPRGAIAAQMIVTPFHIVTMPRHEGDVRFINRSGAPFRGAALDARSSAPTIHPAQADDPFRREVAEAPAPSSTGLEPNFAAALAYLAGPFSGILILLVERANGFVRFHAWQAILGLGGLGLLSAGALVFSFLTLLLSPFAFTLMYRLSEVIAIAWVLAWIVCLWKAFSGARWHMPVAGRYAERLATRSAQSR